MNLFNCVLYTFILKYITLLITESSIAIKISDKLHKNEILEILVKIINNCFNSQTGNIFVRDEHFTQNVPALNMRISILMSINVEEIYDDVNFTNTEELHNIYSINNTIMNRNVSPKENFVIAVSSTSMLAFILKKLRNSIWWNHEGMFLLIDSKLNDGCTIYQALLDIAWSFNILYAVFLCKNKSNKIKLYTFNPFSDYAPSFWNTIKDIEVQENRDKHTFFQHSWTYISSHSLLCGDLYFEKTRILNGYVINLGAFIRPVILPFYKEKVGYKRFGGVNGDISRELWSKLNATTTIKFYSTMGFFDHNGIPNGFYKDLEIQQIDFMMNMIFLRQFWKLQTYPHEVSGICLVSFKDLSLLTSLKKFSSIFTPTFWAFIGIISLIVLGIFKFLMKETISSSVLELLRMLVNVSSQKEPRNLTGRFIFAWVIFLTMMTNSYFQSTLSSVNIAPDPNPVIDSVEGLIKSNMSVHGMASMKQYLESKELQKRYYIEDTSKCMARLLQGQRVACITGCIAARYTIYEGELIHISREKRHTFMTFAVRQEWPLHSRINQILRRLNEAGLITLFRKREQRYFMRPPTVSSDQNQKLSLTNMAFGLCVLMFGIILSIFAFIREVVSMRIKTNATTKL